MSSIRTNLFHLGTVLLSLVALFISFVGLAYLENNIVKPPAFIAPEAAVWYSLTLSFFITVAYAGSLLLNFLDENRFIHILSFVVLDAAILTSTINTLIGLVQADSNVLGATKAVLAGFIIESIILYLWIFVLGASPNSTIAAYVPIVEFNSNNNVSPPNRPISINSSTSHHDIVPATVGSQRASSVTIDSTAGFKYKARSLYAYEANPDDPSEISFAKDEVLEIMDTKGKWWNARRSNGQTGIAPSNYLELIN